MLAAEILRELGELNVKVWAEGDKLIYEPADAVSPDLLARMRDEKPGLMALARPNLEEPVVYVFRVIATSASGVSVVEHHPSIGDGAVFWEKVVALGENGVVELRGPRTHDPFIVLGWLSLIAPEQVAQFRKDWNL